MKPTRAKARAQIWDNMKPEVCRLYIQEKWKLKDIMAAIEESRGFKASLKTWKNKLKEWGYKKNITTHEMQYIATKGEKRRLAGKDTTFFHRGNEIASQRIENFKRRKNQDVPASISHPPSITHHTPPGLSNEEDAEEIGDEFFSYPSYSSQITSSPMSEASSIGRLGSEIQSPLTITSDLPEVMPNSTLDLYLSDELQPWSMYHLLHQLGGHDARIAKQRQTLAQVADLIALSEEQSSPHVDVNNGRNFRPELCCIGDYLVDSCSIVDVSLNDRAPEVANLEELLGHAVTLAEYQQKYEEFATLTLMQELKLAKADEKAGNHEEAEYRCRRILNVEPQVMVQTFLGMLLAKNSRLEESTLLLFSAIAWFIVEFTWFCLEESAARFKAIDALFMELALAWNSDRDWSSLASSMLQMVDTIQNAFSEGNTGQIFPQLFIQGFSLASECMVLEFDDSAKYMYQLLLENSSHLDVVLYGIEIATAHRKYGILLRKERKWTSSAEQLALACESAVGSGTPDILFIALLKSDYFRLRPHLTSEEGTAATKIKHLLTRALMAVQLSRVDEYLLSDLPLNLATLEPGAVPYFAPSPIVNNSALDDGNPTSTTSMSESSSHPYGLLTYPHSISGVTGVSDSAFMVP